MIKGIEPVRKTDPQTGERKVVRGKWRVAYKDKSGKRRYVTIQARTLTEAREIALTIRADAIRGKLGFASRRKDRSPTFRDFVSKYMAHARVSKKSWIHDEFRARRWADFFGQKRLDEITSWDVERYRMMRKEQAAPGTVNRELALLRHMFNLAIRWGDAKANPVDTRSHFFREPKHRVRTLSSDEEERLMAALSRPGREHVRAIVVVALNTGMRRGEILRLRWSDVDFAGGLLTVRETKNGEARVIPMNRVVRETLSGLPRAGDHVFCNPLTGRPIRSIREAFERACREAGVENFRFHDLRHTAATKLVLGGVDLVTVKEILGHKDIKMTLRYAHPTPEGKRRAMEILAENATYMLQGQSNVLALSS